MKHVKKLPEALAHDIGAPCLEKVKLLEETMSNIPGGGLTQTQGLITSTFLGQLKIEPPKQRLIAGGTE